MEGKYGEYGVFIISYSAVQDQDQDQGPMNLLIYHYSKLSFKPVLIKMAKLTGDFRLVDRAFHNKHNGVSTMAAQESETPKDAKISNSNAVWSVGVTVQTAYLHQSSGDTF